MVIYTMPIWQLPCYYDYIGSYDLKFRVVGAGLIRGQAVMISMIMYQVVEMLMWCNHHVGRPQLKVDDRVKR